MRKYSIDCKFSANLNDATKNYVNLLFNFEFRSLNLLGFRVTWLKFPGRIVGNNPAQSTFLQKQLMPVM